MILKPSEIFCINIFFETQFHIFVHHILTNLQALCHARLALALPVPLEVSPLGPTPVFVTCDNISYCLNQVTGMGMNI